jgi:hypothetical protein
MSHGSARPTSAPPPGPPVTTSRASCLAFATAASPQPRILLPFTDCTLPQRALDIAVRMARTENGTLVAVRLERIPLHLPMDTPPGDEVAEALTGIQRAARDLGMRVDPRIGQGRSYRHALLRTLTSERYDRVILAVGRGSGVEFTAADVAWLVGHADGEIVVVAAGSRMLLWRSAA